jgi:predicted Rossmann fold flavoprotein
VKSYDAIIIGAGAAGLMCAIEAGKRGRRVLLIDHANKPGKKILISGGGRCNFTNINVTPEQFISHNPHFCKSALSRYTTADFIQLVKSYDISFYEKTLGQLFCKNKSKDILNLLLEECKKASVEMLLNTSVKNINKVSKGFELKSSVGILQAESLVIATGGLSFPTMGASPFGYKVAEQFDIKVWPVKAGLVPFTLNLKDKEKYSLLSGVSCDAVVESRKKSFRENVLFTHRGLSGPAVLQVSSYWALGESITINLLPDIDLTEKLIAEQTLSPRPTLKTVLSKILPKNLVSVFIDDDILNTSMKSLSQKEIKNVSYALQAWKIKPNGTEGYRTAEVTLGGVDCNAISSKTMEASNVSGLYFIGEVLDITGWLGGYNFQWAWSSGWAAGQVV